MNAPKKLFAAPHPGSGKEKINTRPPSEQSTDALHFAV